MTETSFALIEAGKGCPGALVVNSPVNELLQGLARGHAQHMAWNRRQNHSNFQARFDQVLRELGMKSQEIVAESWPWQADESLVALGVEMFKCWKLVGGLHWEIASMEHKFMGADMVRGRDNIWYACILVCD